MPSAVMLACLVIGIADGDTLTARCTTEAGPINITVRLAEIDAPEKAQAFGTRSRQHLTEVCFKKRADIAPQALDRYGRTVARVVCGRADASLEQLRAGMAWAYTQYASDARIGVYERKARDQRLGLWADPAPVAPWTWRRSQSSRCDGQPPWPRSCRAAAAL